MVILIPAALIAPLIIFVITWLIPEMKNDAKWYAYMDAYDAWERNGMRGEMPKSRDFGWIPPTNR